MILDRELQLELLRKIAECYPFVWTDYERKPDTPEYYKIAVNLNYLKGHGLLTENSTKVVHSTSGNGGWLHSYHEARNYRKRLGFSKR